MRFVKGKTGRTSNTQKIIMRKTLSILAIIAVLSTPAFARAGSNATGGTFVQGEEGNDYEGNGNVIISDGNTYALDRAYGAYVHGGNASGNTLTMTGGYVDIQVTGGAAEGGGDADNNTVTFSGGTTGKVMGGQCGGNSAAGNKVMVSGGTCTFILGGGSVKNAKNNTVIVTGGSDIGFICGGSTESDGGIVSGNTVTICGVDVSDEVIGAVGYNSSGNTVNLVGEGGRLDMLEGKSMTVGAVLGAMIIHGTAANDSINIYGNDIKADSISAFHNLNFYLAEGAQNGDVMLTLTGTDDADLTGVAVSVKCSGATQLTTADSVTLIHASDSSILTDETTTYKVDIVRGVTASYSGTVAVEESDLVLTIGGEMPDPTPVVETDTLKSMTETRTDVAALVNTVADFLATTGMQQARMTAKAAAATGNEGVAPFVALGGSHLRYNTGSHVNANGFNTAVGVAKSVSSVTLGVAGEYGTSDYKSYVGGVRAKGDSKLWGGAILADWQGNHGWHAEGSVSLGRADYDYSAATPLGYTHYSDKASYQSTYVGGGKEFKLSEACNDTVDLYARYMYGHTNGSNATATSGESIHFSGVNSHRSLLGARYNHQLCDQAAVYAGAAWMHEYAGDAKGVIGGFKAPSPSLGGSSGMLELGTSYAPGQDVLLNLNIQGWTGVQRGISGGVGVQVRF